MQQQPPTFKRSTMKISMEEDFKWPSYTFSLHSLNFAAQQGTHYSINMGLCHKTIIDLEKSNTTFQYKITSNQSWSCRQIVWCATEAGPFNRATTAARTTIKPGFKYKLTDYIGTLEQTGEVTCTFNWKEQVLGNMADEMGSSITKTLPNLLHGPGPD